MSKTYDWNDPVTEQESLFGKLPDGDYHFVVSKLSRDFDWLSNCPLADVSLWFESGSTRAIVREFLRLNDSLMWKIVSLFTSCGLRKHGDTGPLPWDDLVGSIGYASVKTNPKKPQYNQIDRYLAIPDEPIPDWVTAKVAKIKAGDEDVPTLATPGPEPVADEPPF